MSDKKIFIADGHHRYDTACNFRDEANKAAGGKLPEHDPLNFVLMMCIGMDDPGTLGLANASVVPRAAGDDRAGVAGEAETVLRCTHRR